MQSKDKKKNEKQLSDSYDIFSDEGDKQNKNQQKQKQNEKQKQPPPQNEKKEKKIINHYEEDGQFYFDLTSRKKVCINEYKGSVNVSIREYFEKDGQTLPTKKGITLNLENWGKLKKYIDEIDECIQNIKK